MTHDPRIQTQRELEMSPCGHYIRTPVEHLSPEVKTASDAVFEDVPDLVERLNRIRKLIATVAAVTRESVEGRTEDQQAWAEVGSLLKFGTDDPWVLVGALQSHFKRYEEHAAQITALQIALLEQQARADKWELTCQAKDAQLTALQAEVEQLKRQREELSKAVDGVIVVERRPIGSATPVTPGHAVATRRSEAP